MKFPRNLESPFFQQSSYNRIQLFTRQKQCLVNVRKERYIKLDKFQSISSSSSLLFCTEMLFLCEWLRINSSTSRGNTPTKLIARRSYNPSVLSIWSFPICPSTLYTEPSLIAMVSRITFSALSYTKEILIMRVKQMNKQTNKQTNKHTHTYTHTHQKWFSGQILLKQLFYLSGSATKKILNLSRFLVTIDCPIKSLHKCFKMKTILPATKLEGNKPKCSFAKSSGS